MTGYVQGTSFVLAQLNTSERKVLTVVGTEIRRAALLLVGHIKREKLSGQVLKRRTGNLSRSINARFENANGVTFRARVGTNASYARRLEYGFKGVENVRAHVMTITQAWGRQLKAPKQVNVRAHTRRVDVKEHSFLRSSLADLRTQIEQSFAKAIRGALA